ncbi:MAG TPA: carbon-nitrogen hydrolase family protein [Streptosporangiaceae bacterium]
MSTIRLSMVQPITHFGPDARKLNIESAEKYVAAAAAGGGQLVVFPESYPGMWSAPVTWTPEAELAGLARRYGVYLIGGFAEPADAAGHRCYNTFALYGPDGSEVGRYRRTTPTGAPWIYKGGRYWDFDWINATELPVFDTDLGRIAMVMCSEVYATECSRAMALQGADLTVLPAGLPGPRMSLYQTWRTLVWARAIENIMFTAVCGNILHPDADPDGIAGEGLTMICTPEEILVDTGSEGVHTADLDLGRLRFLRESRDRLPGPGERDVPWKCKPGNLRDWRRDAVMQANPVLLTGAPDR